eukprot:g8302.t1
MRSETAIVLVLFGLLSGVGETTAFAKPNVIVIFADDLGYGDLGCYGHPKFKTPHIDRMAREGVRMTQFYVPVPYCAPSRATLLTGRYPWRNGVMTNPTPDARPPKNDVGIPDEEITLGEAFKSAGYATSCIGKWHLGHRPRFYPTKHGFDEYYGILYSNDMRPVQLIDGTKVAEYPVVQATLTKRYTERAVSFIKRNRSKPFFLYLPHAMPHKPLAASEQFYKKSGAGLYGDVMAELDWSVGEIFKTLKTLKLDENTLVILTSDNGPWFGGSTAGLRGMKAVTWDGGIRVPMIARWPGKIPAGKTIDEPCGSIDIFPTVLKACGVALPADRVIDGKDILPVLRGTARSPHDALFAMRGNRLMTVRSGCWKLHVLPAGATRYRKPGKRWIDPRAPDGVTILAPYEQYQPHEFPGIHTGPKPAPMLLFDLKADRAEQHNVAAKHPDVVKRLKAMLVRYAMTLCRNQPDAEDALQAAFVQIARDPRKLANARKPWPYLVRVIRNESIQILRKSRAQPFDERFDPVSREESVETVSDQEVEDVVRSAIGKLPPAQAEVVALKIWEDMTFAEVGEILGVSPNTAASRYRYALDKLTQLLQALNPEGHHALESSGVTVPRVYRFVIESGLRAGRLPQAMETLSDHARNLLSVRRRISFAMIYPCIILVIAYYLFWFLIGNLTNVMLDLAQQAGRTDSFWIGTVRSLYEFVGSLGHLPPVVLVLLLIVWHVSSRFMTRSGGIAGVGLRWIPGVGGVIRLFQLASFAELAALLIDHDVPAAEALQLAAEASGNRQTIDDAEQVAAAVDRGGALADAMPLAKNMPPFMRWMIQNGARQNALSASFRQVSEIYRQRAIARSDQFSLWFPVAVTLIVGGGAVLLYALTLFAPLIEMMNAAASAEEARAQLEASGLRVKTIELIDETQPPASETDEEVLLREHDFLEYGDSFLNLGASSLPLESGLRALSEEIPSARMKRALVGISERLERGESWEDIAVSGAVDLPPALRGLIQARLTAKDAAPVFAGYLHYARRAAEIRRSIWNGLLYPAVLLGVLFLILIVYLVWIVPEFESIYTGIAIDLLNWEMRENASRSLPVLTRLMLGASWLLIEYWPAVLGGVCVAVGLMFLIARQIGRVGRRRLLNAVPFVGSALRAVAMATFCRMFAILLQRGVTMSVAIRSAGIGCGDAVIERGCDEMAARMDSGSTLQEAAIPQREFSDEMLHVFDWATRPDVFRDALLASGDAYEGQAGLRAGLVRLIVEPLAVFFVALVLCVVYYVTFQPLSEGKVLWAIAIASNCRLSMSDEIDAVSVGMAKRQMRRALHLSDRLRSGETLESALRRTPDVIPPDAALAAIAAAQDGNLPEVLRECAIRHTSGLRLTRGDGETPAFGVAYLLVFPLLAFSIVGFLMYYVAPYFKKIFDNFGVELPDVTQQMITIADFLDGQFVLTLPLVAAVGFVIVYAMRHYERGSRASDIWLIGRFFRRHDVPAVLRALAGTVSANRPLGDALWLLSENHSHRFFSKSLATVAAKCASGDDCWYAMRDAGLLKRHEVSVLRSAQRVGNLPWALNRLADVIEQRHAHRRVVILEFVKPLMVAAEAANVMERLSARDWNELTQKSVDGASISDDAKAGLREPTLKVTVTATETEPLAKRIRVELRWKNRQGDEVSDETATRTRIQNEVESEAMKQIVRHSIRDRNASKRDGAIIIFAMIALLLASAISVAMLKTAFAERRLAMREQTRVQANWLMQSGLERAAARIAKNSDYKGETWKIPATELGGRHAGTVVITVAAVPSDSRQRQSILIAVGGGVVGDAGGFVAATYARGIPFVQVPTTLLAQVDSSVGGKVGINHPQGKNLIGAFYQPLGVVIDTATLATLPDRDYRSGLAEVIKYGVILDEPLFEFLEANVAGLNSRDRDVMRHVVSRCCRLKADVVEGDEQERTGLRAVLNYGHTFAHAYEALAGYGELLHGEAVAIGMIDASRLAERLGRIPAELTSRQVTGYIMSDAARFKRAGLVPVNLPPFLVGRHRGYEFWMNDQKWDYFRRHTMLHEATHCFMYANRDVRFPVWYMEGMADYFATHWTDRGGVTHFGVMPQNRADFDGFARIDFIRQYVAKGRTRSIDGVRRITADDTGKQEPYAYAWSWSLCKFLNGHPRYGKRFRELGRILTGARFEYEFGRFVQQHSARLNMEWALYIHGLDYGYDLQRAAIDIIKAEPMAPGSVKSFELATNRGWQSSAIRVEKGKTYRVQATGKFVIAEQPKPWICEPQGVSILYAGGLPLGKVVATVWPDDSPEHPPTGAAPPVIPIGRGRELTAKQTGIIYFRVNDLWSSLDNNTGTLKLTVQSVKP